MEPQIKEILEEYKAAMQAELKEILQFWIERMPDKESGGFVGRIDENNFIHTDAPKGSVLNSRMLWAFSSAFSLTNDYAYLHMAKVAYNFIRAHFIDYEFGGVFWSVSANGKPLDTKKQIYALAFALYGCSAYFEASRDTSAKATAIELFQTIEKYSFDTAHSGYLDAFARDWTEMDDMRLSAKDANEKKTMNTHLHVLEAYTALYRIWPGEQLKNKIQLLIKNFSEYIIDASTNHLVLFFDEFWSKKSSTISYGHDIEAAWLLLEAAEVIQDSSLVNILKQQAVRIANAASEGLDADGGLWYEYEPATNHFIKEKHSWVQAEAMIGFMNAWQITGDESYLQKSVSAWQYTKSLIKDQQYGEWYWGRNGDGSIMAGQDKAGIWKCPYHNSRACIEIINRISSLIW